MFMGVVSVVNPSVNLLSLGSLDEHSSAICLDLLIGDELHSDLLRLGWLVLGGDGDDEAVLEFRRRQLLLLYIALFCLSSQNVHLHCDPLGHSARVLGGGEGVGGVELLVVGGEGGGDELPVVGGEAVGGGELLVVVGEVELLVVGGEGVGGGELLVVVGEGGGGGELLVVGGEGGGGSDLLVNLVSDTSFASLHFSESITK
jgi:hypothetical protein